jgi:hypothetical protein
VTVAGSMLTGRAGSSTSTGRSRYSKIRANSASELITETLVLSRPVIGRNRLPCRVVKATRVPMLTAPAVTGSPAAR